MTLGDMLLAANLNSSCSIQALKVIADAHNAALAAEREQTTARELANEMLTAQRNDLREQLAAERERVKLWQEEVKLWEEGEMPMITEVNQLRSQLAAERLLRASDLRETGKTIRQLREQLAAERENVKQLEDDVAKRGFAIDGLREQLAVLVEALKAAREIHKAMRPDLPIETLLRLSLQFNQVIDAALAAMREKK